MKIAYDEGVDALYISFKAAKQVEIQHIDEDADILEELAQMEKSELAEIEGVDFGEVRELLVQEEKRGISSDKRTAKR